MLKIKNWKRNRSLPLGIYLLAGLFLFGVESAEAKKLTHERTEYCRNQVYVSNNQGASLQAQPDDKASSIAQLHYMQYLCIVGNDSKNTEEGYSWIKVKKVPLAIKENQISCHDMGLPDNCTKPTDFLTEWKIKPPKGKKCRLSIHVDDEGQLLIVAKGVCPTGWVKERDVQFFAD